MTEEQGQRAGIVAFLVGLIAALAFFAFFPGMPHVIDWGAILVSLGVGVLARLGWRAWRAKTDKERQSHHP
ncbi:hypothetical protein [Streptomyces sp. SID5910]|uniref:hypothetical protein n=1 Tax=Streptomyces sp. SID5910 TaxID=2690312 RepID=UPI001368C822|nr:hypothetical protein [Streptomyces sp. SID5910]MYR40763.1 hypothetical protein [Streptomyces sp. SID5910]